LQVESYGVIQLTTFFMNQLMMTIKLLEFLGSDEEINWREHQDIMNFDFKEFMNESLNGKTSKVISWQLEHSGLIGE